MFKKLPPYLKNKYSVALIVFFIWLMFFDHNRIINQVKLLNTLGDLHTEKEYYQEQIKRDSARLDELTTNKDNLEKYAREQFLMKKPNEDVFVVLEEKDKKERKKSERNR